MIGNVVHLNRHMTYITDEEMRSGIAKDGTPIKMWGHLFGSPFGNPPNDIVLVFRDIDGDEQTSAMFPPAAEMVERLRGPGFRGVVFHHVDEFDHVEAIFWADFVDGQVIGGQVWPYVPPEVDVDKQLKVLHSLTRGVP